jgi:NAD(P)-dependent dehydrogenase (short-subunit alcohol dehydrogenase family)
MTPTGGSLNDRAVLVTGGNGGIGLGMALACAEAGARIVIWGRDDAKNDDALAQLRATGADAFAFVCDVTSEQEVRDTFDASVDAAGGRIDATFANAGTTGRGIKFLDLDLEEWHRVFRTNLDGVFLTLQTAARHMMERGGGSLVAVSSVSAIHGAPGNEAYGASKTALLGLVRSLAVGLARHQIRVNAIVPGWTRTGLSEAGFQNDRFRDVTTGRTPVRRWADPSEMGAAAVFLADPTTTFHTGDALVIDGGYSIF